MKALRAIIIIATIAFNSFLMDKERLPKGAFFWLTVITALGACELADIMTACIMLWR